MAKWGLAAVQRRILNSVAEEALDGRGDGTRFEQLFNFRYADGAQMLTWGGILVSPWMQEAFAQCRFEDLEHVSRDDQPVEVIIPALTSKEALHLNAQLPLAEGASLASEGIHGRRNQRVLGDLPLDPLVPRPIAG